jgi:hypothetical protein
MDLDQPKPETQHVTIAPAVRIGEAGAIYAFMGWLTSRTEISGPFGGALECSDVVPLITAFCKSQGWEADLEADPHWYKRLLPYPDR